MRVEMLPGGVHSPRQAGDCEHRPGQSVHARMRLCMPLKNQGCKLSMDGRGAWKDDVFVERLGKSVKYERVYMYAYDSVT